MAEHHAGLAIEAGQAAHNALVVSKVAVAVHLDKIGEDVVDVVHRVGPLRVAGDLGDLPRIEVAVNGFGQLLAFFVQLVNLGGDVHRRLALHIAQLFDLGFEFGNRLLKIKKSFL